MKIPQSIFKEIADLLPGKPSESEPKIFHIVLPVQMPTVSLGGYTSIGGEFGYELSFTWDAIIEQWVLEL